MKDASDALIHPEQAAYLEALEPPRDELLAKLEARAREKKQPISDPEVASFLAIMVRASKARFVLELGTNVGYGAIVLARAAGPNARVLTVELDSELVALARYNIEQAGLSDRIDVHQGDAVDVAEQLDVPVDFAYIDCVKEDYPRYLEILIPKLSAGGVIVADNVLWKGLVAKSAVPEAERVRVEALRQFNLALVGHPRLRGMVLPFGDGVGVAVKLGPPGGSIPAPRSLGPRGSLKP